VDGRSSVFAIAHRGELLGEFGSIVAMRGGDLIVFQQIRCIGR
jgi:hypothetical protein